VRLSPKPALKTNPLVWQNSNCTQWLIRSQNNIKFDVKLYVIWGRNHCGTNSEEIKGPELKIVSWD